MDYFCNQLKTSVSNLSYWERSSYFHDVDVVIIGAGIVGLCSGISLLEKDPGLRILILERHYLPLGASTKNAGFACFGSPSELLDDLKRHDESKVFSLFKRRFDGIHKLLTYTGETAIEFNKAGGYELIHPKHSAISISQNELDYLNENIKRYTGLARYFYFDDDKLQKFQLNGFTRLIANDHEAGIHPVKMIELLSKLYTNKGGKILYGASLHTFTENDIYVTIELHDQTKFKTRQILFCVNGFAKSVFPELEVQAARNNVFVIQANKTLRLNGCFHMDRGYVYFRNVDGKLLIGGGRNQDLENEFTDEFGFNEKINLFLLEFAKENILNGDDFQITDQWSGIMGLGSEKKPIIKMITSHAGVAVRMGGMGIAIGSLVGEEAAQMIYTNLNQQQ